jgi:hypothetical protein
MTIAIALSDDLEPYRHFHEQRNSPKHFLVRLPTFVKNRVIKINGAVRVGTNNDRRDVRKRKKMSTIP